MLTLSSSFFLRALLQHKRNTFIRRISLRSACTRCSGEYAMHGGRLCASSTLQHSLPLAFFLPPLGVHTATLLNLPPSVGGEDLPSPTPIRTYIHTHAHTPLTRPPCLPRLLTSISLRPCIYVYSFGFILEMWMRGRLNMICSSSWASLLTG